ncbi:TPA: hypothetical protein N0F65_000084 [Lagenidium giganteum]|uniref:Lipoxygenase domain-containing protein n=1 Tax=Lagenidium giganteum TaxID=4803 RepID=A0AAV2YJG9_9STRA|nr:TPA: hypothetical protein N0F65_000084 [Lagenidium giganteum]
MQSIDDYSRVYKSIEDFIDTPISRDQSDAHFGTIRRTINGFNMKLVTADDVQFTQLDFNLTSYQVTSLCGDSLSRLVANNAFFVSDFTDVTKYNDKERPEKYTPSGQGFFCVNYQQDGALLPMAIRLTDTNLMYTPFDHPNEWRLAKMAFNAMEISAQQMQHFVETHLVYEPIRVEMMRAMSPYHPIYNLMDHHLFGVFGIPILARVGLLEDQTTLDSTFGWGAVGCLHYVLNYFQSPTLSLSYSFLDDIKARGVHHIPNHKVVEYGTLLHAELSKFTAAYIDVYYKSDRDVANDRELQNWALWSSQLELVQDFPSELRTKTQLHRLLTHIIFQVSVKHHAMNGQVTWHSISAPFSVPSLWNEPLPTRKGVAIDLSKYIIPDQYLPDLVHVAATFQREIPSRLTLLNAYDAQRFQQHPELQDVLVQFKKNMMTLDTAMAAREAQAAQPYEFLRPSRLPYFGWI